MPNQCAWNELRILPRNTQEIEWPKPHPGHQVKPIAFNGQRLKCAGPTGFVKARATIAATQKTNSKYFENRRLINFF